MLILVHQVDEKKHGRLNPARLLLSESRENSKSFPKTNKKGQQLFSGQGGIHNSTTAVTTPHTHSDVLPL